MRWEQLGYAAAAAAAASVVAVAGRVAREVQSLETGLLATSILHA